MSSTCTTAMLEHHASASCSRTVEHDAAAHATDGRTDGLTQKDLLSDESFSNASRAGGQKTSTISEASDEHIDALLADLGIVQAKRAKVIRTGERPPISRMLRGLVYKRDNWTCQQCGKMPWARLPERLSGPLHLDHIVPWSAGGIDRSDNLRVLCGPCNVARSNFVYPDDKLATPIVRVCAPCIKPEWFPNGVPADSFSVYCASRHHISWAIPGWRVI